MAAPSTRGKRAHDRGNDPAPARGRRRPTAADSALSGSAPAEWAIAEPRWRRDQRSRRRRLSQRGRATLASVTFVSVVVLGWVVDPFSPVRAASGPMRSSPRSPRDAPPVAEAAPESEPGAKARPEVPAFVMERLPMTRRFAPSADHRRDGRRPAVEHAGPALRAGQLAHRAGSRVHGRVHARPQTSRTASSMCSRTATSASAT
jgi:hypothetical protein